MRVVKIRTKEVSYARDVMGVPDTNYFFVPEGAWVNDIGCLLVYSNSKCTRVVHGIFEKEHFEKVHSLTLDSQGNIIDDSADSLIPIGK